MSVNTVRYSSMALLLVLSIVTCALIGRLDDGPLGLWLFLASILGGHTIAAIYGRATRP